MELKIEKLSKTYPGGVRALNDVSLTVPGGMFGLLGPNGAGKSTLMRIIATLQEPDSGSITLDGIDVLKDKNEVRKILGYLPQEFGLEPKAIAFDLLEHFAILKGLNNHRSRREHLERLLEWTNLIPYRRKRLSEFSGGMKQRFGIAQALIGDPKLLIVDEPTAGLDPEERIRFHNILSEISEQIVVILSTHIVADVSDVCRNMAIIHKGKLLMIDDPVQAARNLAGKVWRNIVDHTDSAAMDPEMLLISSKRFGGRIKVRVYSESNPGNGFEQSEPDVEDVYFITIRKHDSTFSANGKTVSA